MERSGISTWQGEDGDVAANELFKVFVQDETANGVTGTSFKQNIARYFLVQHDQSIKVIRIVPSMGSMQGAARSISYAQTETGIVFTTETPEHTLKYMPDPDSVDGTWFIGYPGKAYNVTGTPERKIIGRVITVDVEGFGGAPIPFTANYIATFLQYQWLPDDTDLPDDQNPYPVAFTVYYEAR